MLQIASPRIIIPSCGNLPKQLPFYKQLMDKAEQTVGLMHGQIIDLLDTDK